MFHCLNNYASEGEIMKKIFALVILLVCTLCSCKYAGDEINYTTNDRIGIDFGGMLDKSLKDIKYTFDEDGINLEKDTSMMGTYYCLEKVSGYNVKTTLQFSYFDDVDSPNWEKEKPESKHQLAWFSKQWNWDNNEYTDADYEYIVKIYQELCKTYGEPYQLQEGPEGYRIGEDLSTGFSAMWNTKEYENPNVILTYTNDSAGVNLVYTVKGEKTANYINVG